MLVRLVLLLSAAVASMASLVVDGDDPPDPVELYGICLVTAECVREAEACLRFGPDFVGAQFSLCSMACEDDNDCPYDGHCFTPTQEGIPKLCVARCTQACEDCCEEGLTCRVNLAPEPLCRP